LKYVELGYKAKLWTNPFLELKIVIDMLGARHVLENAYA
jgi:hypothetical protein